MFLIVFNGSFLASSRSKPIKAVSDQYAEETKSAGLTPPKLPQTNGVVERFNGRIGEVPQEPSLPIRQRPRSNAALACIALQLTIPALPYGLRARYFTSDVAP